MKQIILLFLFFQVCQSAVAQAGLFEFTVHIDKSESQRINDSLMASLEKGRSIAFEGSDFYAPLDKAASLKKVSDLDLCHKSLTALSAVMMWDTQTKEMVLLGYAPVYGTKKPFYIGASFNRLLHKQDYSNVKAKTEAAFFQQMSNAGISPANSGTFRRVALNSADCIYHLPLGHLPGILLKQWLAGYLMVYEDPQLTYPIRYTEELYKKAAGGQALVLYEQWADTNRAKGTPLFFETDYWKRSSRSIGLLLPDKKAVWIDYQAYEAMLRSSKFEEDKYRVMVYDLYFQSALCRQLKLRMKVE